MFANGRPHRAIPGPSILPDRVLSAMHRAAPDIYAGPLPDMVPGLWPDLRRLAGTRGDVALYIGNGHAAWEAANANLFAPGDRVLVLVSGLFGHGWAANAAALGAAVEVIDHGRSLAADPDRLEARLRDDLAGGAAGDRIRAVLVCHVDTASGVRADIAALRAAMDAAGHPALLCVDAIASLGCDRLEMDAMGADVVLSASQKGLMVPPGLAFLWFNARARAAADAARLRRGGGLSPHWDWARRADGAEFWHHWNGTAPTHHLYGLRESLDMIAEEGLAAIWARHEGLAAAVWAAFAAWGAGNPAIALNVPNPDHRARAVTAARLGAPHATALRDWVQRVAGVTLGVGLGAETEADPKADGALRVAHMGHVSAHGILGVLGAMEAGMQALSIPHGTGALEAAASEIARRAGR